MFSQEAMCNFVMLPAQLRLQHEAHEMVTCYGPVQSGLLRKFKRSQLNGLGKGSRTVLSSKIGELD